MTTTTEKPESDSAYIFSRLLEEGRRINSDNVAAKMHSEETNLKSIVLQNRHKEVMLMHQLFAAQNVCPDIAKLRIENVMARVDKLEKDEFEFEQSKMLYGPGLVIGTMLFCGLAYVGFNYDYRSKL